MHHENALMRNSFICIYLKFESFPMDFEALKAESQSLLKYENIHNKNAGHK